jgi:hypothetical protein
MSFMRSVRRTVAVTSVAAFVALAVSARNADPTFADDVAPILYKNCTTCHHVGGIGPFSLIEYDSAKANAKEIREMVSTGQMPPWHAEGPHGRFRNDRRLSAADKTTILRWIETGAKAGDLKRLPPAPNYTNAWEIGEPDLTVTMQDHFTVPTSGTIEYQYFEVPTNLTEEKWVTAVEIRPGARSVVHHVIVYARVPIPSDTATVRPQPNPAAPRPAGNAPPPVLIRNPDHGIPDDGERLDKRHPPPRRLGAMVGATAPGTNVLEFPDSLALRLRPGTILTFQMHYTAQGHEMHDRTSVGFRFAKEPPYYEMLATAFYNGSFRIPPGAKDVAIPAEIKAGQPIRVWGMLPHTHLRGTRWQYKLEKPDGTSEIILDVPRYDFNWQTYYMFANPIDMPAGSRIVSTAWYDNSKGNKDNPDPTKEVRWGDQTWEEMQYTGFLYSIPARRLRP